MQSLKEAAAGAKEAGQDASERAAGAADAAKEKASVRCIAACASAPGCQSCVAPCFASVLAPPPPPRERLRRMREKGGWAVRPGWHEQFPALMPGGLQALVLSCRPDCAVACPNSPPL